MRKRRNVGRLRIRCKLIMRHSTQRKTNGVTIFAPVKFADCVSEGTIHFWNRRSWKKFHFINFCAPVNTITLLDYAPWEVNWGFSERSPTIITVDVNGHVGRPQKRRYAADGVREEIKATVSEFLVKQNLRAGRYEHLVQKTRFLFITALQ